MLVKRLSQDLLPLSFGGEAADRELMDGAGQLLCGAGFAETTEYLAAPDSSGYICRGEVR
jgi:hypothetical protein